METITKPCEECSEPVTDSDDPGYKGTWLCYYCHCVRRGKDPKRVLNALAGLIKDWVRTGKPPISLDEARGIGSA